MSKILLVGKNGAGKGTLRDNFMRERGGNYRNVEMSAMLAKRRETDPEIKAIMDNGGLVSDKVILDIIKKELDGETRSIIFDGFPRTKEQAQAMVKLGLKPDAIIEVDLPDEIVVDRLTKRRVCSKCRKSYTVAGGYNPPKQDGICDACGGDLVQRPDDKEETVRKRLQVYQDQTYPVIQYLTGLGVSAYCIDNSKDDDQAQIRFNNIMKMY